MGTEELITEQQTKSESDIPTEGSEEILPESSTSSSSSSFERKSRPHDHLNPIKHWQVGEQCQAVWEKDGKYYEAIINEITTDGDVSVTFQGYGNTSVTSLGLLKAPALGFTASAASANRKEQIAKQREYMKKKKEKKKERFKKKEKGRKKKKKKKKKK